MHFKSNLKGTVISMLLLLVLVFLISIYYHFGDITKIFTGYLASFAIATAFLLGGFISGFSAGEKGLLNGAISALISVIILLIIVSLGLDGIKNWGPFLINSAFAFFASIIGGIIGVSKN